VLNTPVPGDEIEGIRYNNLYNMTIEQSKYVSSLELTATGMYAEIDDTATGGNRN
jgi:hypothetical protein